MNTEAGRLYLLGCDFVDSALTSLTESWEQHIATLQSSIIDICNRELRRSEIPSHLATPMGKRKRRFTSAQKAIQALLNNASNTNLSSSISSQSSQANNSRVTRARAKKDKQDTSSNGSFEQQGKTTGQNSSVTETGKGKRKGKGKTQKDDEGFVKPLEPITKTEIEIKPSRSSSTASSISSSSPALPSSVVKKERDEVDNKVSSHEMTSPIPQSVVKNEVFDENDDPIFWNIKRVSSPSPRKKGMATGPQITISNHDQVMTPVENGIKKQSSPDGPADSEWTTDDESFESIESIGDETYRRMTEKKSPNSSRKLTTVKKQKRKQTEYFTPSIPHKSTRMTRATANKVEITPKINSLTKSNLETKGSSSVTKSSNKLVNGKKLSGTTTSGSSIASSQATIASVGRTDSLKKNRPGPRNCNTPDSKALTASAAKKRLEEEEKRKATLAHMKEKEDKVLQSKQENLKMKAQLTKLKNEEKRKKIEQIKKKEEEELREKRQKEQSKLEEIEKRRKEKEEARRREIMRNQEAARRKQAEFDLRKQQEEAERRARIMKQEEQNRLKREENENIRKQQEKILRMIAQHNDNFLKGQNTSDIQQKVDQPAPVSQFKQPFPPTSNEVQPPPPTTTMALPMNRTFSIDKEGELVKKEKTPPKKEESYQITPPPKHKPTPVNYDISDIKSDDDTDDEERPRKQIPSWAKGDALIAALDKQFAKSRRARERQIREIFPTYDFSIELTDIFKSSRVVHPKYDKRTSSAVWSSPPCNSTINCSLLTELTE